MRKSIPNKSLRRIVATGLVATAISGAFTALPNITHASAPSPRGGSTCGTPAAAVPGDGANFQTVWGDVDGDTVLDNVTLYSHSGQWHVNVTSSQTGTQSDTVVQLDVHDTVSVSFEDIDHSLGAPTPPPVAIMALGQGANADGILGSFTFLTLNPSYCVQQWVFSGAPFQWVALQEPGHVTGMICDGAMGTIYYTLVDSEQNPDGSWHVITRRLTHNFTTAQIEFLPEQTVADSPTFVDDYGNINNCGHAALTGVPTAPPAPTAPGTTPAASTPGSTPAGAGGGCSSVPAGASSVQAISGDIDGDAIADTVTLFNAGGQWWVQASSSVKGWTSATRVRVNVDDSMSISLFDFDYSAGAQVPPAQAVMATGTGANSDGITENFTFLTNNSHYCIGQWTYSGAPFQWVSLVEPGHVTDLCGEGTAGTYHHLLVDAVQNADGTWHVITKELKHNFTAAVITPLSDETLPNDPAYGTAGSFCIH